MADDPSSPVDPSSPKPDVEDSDAVKAAATPEVAASDPAGPDADDDDANDDAAPEKNGSDNDDDEEEEQLSDVDEDFEDYDPATAEIAETEDRPAVTIDEEAARGLKASKRKRTGDDGKPRKPKEGRREKKRRPGDGAGDGGSDDEEGGEATATSKRARRSRPEDGGASSSAPRRKKSASPEVNEEDLTPEERRKRALNRAIDLAIRNPNKRRRKADEDVSIDGPVKTIGYGHLLTA